MSCHQQAISSLQLETNFRQLTENTKNRAANSRVPFSKSLKLEAYNMQLPAISIQVATGRKQYATSSVPASSV